MAKSAGSARTAAKHKPTADWRPQFRRRLLAWFRRNARDLPWRRNRDPYRVWVSEIMLQQTTVAAVVPYFERFMAALPDIAALAAAREETVLRLWEGLGYYRRARQLHRAAQVLATEHGAEIPNDADAIRRLPGIGRYTAGAILSIAFDRAEPILEANTVRLISRLLAYRGDPARAEGQRLLWQTAESLLPVRGAGAFNQALMELGSQVCRPRDPDCPHCPVAELCATNRAGLQASIPAPRQKKNFEDVRTAAVVIRRRGKVLLVRNGDGERWAGLWDFPRFECLSGATAPLAEELTDKVRERTGVAIEAIRPLTTFRHGVTRFRITLDCFEAAAVGRVARNGHSGDRREIAWLRPVELHDYPLSSTGRKLANLVCNPTAVNRRS
jgi:A/G-specific adenine glycosylase